MCRGFREDWGRVAMDGVVQRNLFFFFSNHITCMVRSLLFFKNLFIVLFTVFILFFYDFVSVFVFICTLYFFVCSCAVVFVFW